MVIHIPTKCELCTKELNEFHYVSLRQYELSEKSDEDKKRLIEVHGFCSNECANEYKNRIEDKGIIEIDKISRCVGFYDCLRLDNLRKMCQDEERLNKSSTFPGFDISPLIKRCEPAQVGIIKSSLALLDLFENFKEETSSINSQILRNAKETGKINKKMLRNAIQSDQVNENMLKYTKFLTLLTILITVLTVSNIALLLILM